MTLIKWMHCCIMPWLGWYFFIALAIGASFAIYFKFWKKEQEIKSLMEALTPYIVLWLWMILIAIWFAWGGWRLKRERSREAKQKGR